MSTLKKIAGVAGCSMSTVSRALNNCHDVSTETRERILEIAKDLGYFQRKKNIKKENRRKNEFNIAIICPELESDYYAKLVVCFSKHLSKNNHRTIIYNYAFDNKEQDRLIEMCRDACNIDGIISLGQINNAVNYRDIAIAHYTRQSNEHIAFCVNHAGAFDEEIKALGNKKGQSFLFVG